MEREKEKERKKGKVSCGQMRGRGTEESKERKMQELDKEWKEKKKTQECKS